VDAFIKNVICLLEEYVEFEVCLEAMDRLKSMQASVTAGYGAW